MTCMYGRTPLQPVIANIAVASGAPTPPFLLSPAVYIVFINPHCTATFKYVYAHWPILSHYENNTNSISNIKN